MNQTLNDLIKELRTKKQVKVEYLLPKLKKIKREIEPEIVDSFGNQLKIGDEISRSDTSKNRCIEYAKNNDGFSKFDGMMRTSYIADGFHWNFTLSVKAYKANPKKYNKLLGIK